MHHVSNQYNAYNYNYLLSLYLVFEAQIPENVVDQMNQALVNQWYLLDNSALGRVPATKEAGRQRHVYYEWRRHLQLDLNIK